MGHRDDLLVGAKRCLYEKGYARTTARDIVAVSGTNLASIGYHFGSKEALLNEALIQATEEWGDELERAILAVGADAIPGSMERFEAIWTQIIELFEKHRQLWSADFEMFAQIEHAPAVQVRLAEGMRQARAGFGRLFQALGSESDDDPSTWAVGSFYQALLTGVMAQWLVDPKRAPTGRDLAEGLRIIISDAEAARSAHEADATGK